VCDECGRIEEFYDVDIERLQEAAARKKGFTLRHHSMRLFGVCAACARKSPTEEEVAGASER